ncbi:hypothetical protein D1872_240080 [compost metagenome]
MKHEQQRLIQRTVGKHPLLAPPLQHLLDPFPDRQQILENILLSLRMYCHLLLNDVTHFLVPDGRFNNAAQEEHETLDWTVCSVVNVSQLVHMMKTLKNGLINLLLASKMVGYHGHIDSCQLTDLSNTCPIISLLGEAAFGR